MNEILKTHIEKSFLEYSSGKYYNALIEARDEYFAITGAVNENDDDFESRMRCFHDWFLFQYIEINNTRTFFKEYALKHDVDMDIAKSFFNISYSLFEYSGENFKKQMVLTDIIHKRKETLQKGHPKLALIKKDLFVGRVIHYQKNTYLLDGICTIPSEVLPVLEKEAKGIRKRKDPRIESEFLLKIEYLKNRWKSYSHVPPLNIFQFNQLS